MPEIVFKGKEYVYNHHLTVPYRPLVPQADKGVGAPDLSGNLVIHGDNLHALKSLLPRYAGSVDLVFIDPPYNTGNEGWCYSDGVNSPIMKEWLSTNPVDGEDMLRHDKWLCMMWPRLVLLRELLSERGSIWITLDDNEVHRARMVLDEIFGDESFVAQVAWHKVYSPRMDASGLSKDHDIVLVYAKSKSDLAFSNPVVDQSDKQFTFVEPETGKRARLRTLRKEGSNSLRTDRPNGWYRIDDPDGNGLWPVKPDGTEGTWRWEKPAVLAELKKPIPQLLFEKNKNGAWEIWVKQYFQGETERPVSTVWSHQEFGHTHEAAEEIKQLFGEKVFQTPKPTRLIQAIVELATTSDALILDSFAGSGTTAHAVLKANAKDGGQRRFILVEGEDYADTLTAERVRRAIRGYAWQGTQRETLLEEKITLTQFKKAAEWLAKVEAIKRAEGLLGADEQMELGAQSPHPSPLPEGEGARQSPLPAGEESKPRRQRFDRIEVKIDDGVLRVEGVRRVSEMAPGLGGRFTYCTLGEAVELEKLLSGEKLPAFDALGAWLFYTATGGALPPLPEGAPQWYLGQAQDAHVWLVYQPDLNFLKSPQAALTLSLAERLQVWGREHDAQRERAPLKHLVFAPAKYLSNQQLKAHGVDYAPLPFALYRES